MTGPAVGLYSISVRGFDVPGLLDWAAREHIPFIHLRGGRRGFDLARRDTVTLRRWRATTRVTVPISGVTADTDLADLVDMNMATRRTARDEVARLAEAAHVLGAGWLRLLARRPLPRAGIGPEAGLAPRSAVPLLVELHDSAWLAKDSHAALLALLTSWPRLRLLADTTQLASALAGTADASALRRLDDLLGWVDVLHLSDPGTGLSDNTTRLIAGRLARRVAVGQRVEVAVEWTGTDRSPQTCLSRYRTHAAWWTERCTESLEMPS